MPATEQSMVFSGYQTHNPSFCFTSSVKKDTLSE